MYGPITSMRRMSSHRSWGHPSTVPPLTAGGIDATSGR